MSPFSIFGINGDIIHLLVCYEIRGDLCVVIKSVFALIAISKVYILALCMRNSVLYTTVYM